MAGLRLFLMGVRIRAVLCGCTNRPVFGFVEREYFFPGLPFLTINPMFPVARTRAARAPEGRSMAMASNVSPRANGRQWPQRGTVAALGSSERSPRPSARVRRSVIVRAMRALARSFTSEDGSRLLTATAKRDPSAATDGAYFFATDSRSHPRRHVILRLFV